MTSAEVASVLRAFISPSLPWLNRDLLLETRFKRKVFAQWK